ncbi:MAG TPA: undecaprenyldiphospho-muramoylpentapeptide beta-N-acetylglucosaminyltransferase [Desulfobacteraceae bacterium]|nr:undecaprenyldiphospho-muramoylpentapeptide beta-N-acetylglucosaminyltransferase [Desulfobacteraceae bacterium]HPJ66915.1 undecaprenyldiphospho-muramoylpentapeptide beta-N-acetylglucosaminyltransferase [Desulfobacteraceae bacterium]HPQ27603.1 undecaprenyldiphospho-muramoylpentapeptide beta-N-acetylglucosaminyltransferase [Desulfobacteraceae bacterium]
MLANRHRTDKKSKHRLVIIAGGGTGGHLFPGIAIAIELKKRFEASDILFVVGRKRMNQEILFNYGYKSTHIDVEGLKGRGWLNLFAGLWKMPKSLIQAMIIIKKKSPCMVIGMGGYSSGPMCLAAKLMGIKTAVHEQNSYPGVTNRILSRFVDRVFISFEDSKPYLKSREIFLTGNPVRDELLSTEIIKHKGREQFTILVIGGSQGAKAINDAFVDALSIIKKAGRNPHVIHQSGAMDYERLTKEYGNRNIHGDIMPFIKDMATAYNRADIVVSRAGATTIFELAAVGRPSVLIPYPYATNNHQEINARSLVRAGGAEMIKQKDLNGEVLARTLINFMDNPSLLQNMGKNAKKIARHDAAKLIVDRLSELDLCN